MNSPTSNRLFNLIKKLLSLGFPTTDSAIQEIVCLLIDQVANEPDPAPRLTVEERAVQLGYPVCLVSKSRCMLGKWVAKSTLERVKGERYCYGKLVEVNTYLVTPELDDEIRAFYKA